MATGAEGRNDVVELTDADRPNRNIGYVVYRTAEVCIRVREDKDGTVILVHRMIDGREYAPKGYVVGVNWVLYRKE